MKSIFVIFISLFTFSLAQAQVDQVTAQIDGLGCAFCANGLERAFKDVKQKQQFTVDLDGGKMQFAMPVDAKISVKDITKRVDKAGYTTTNVTIIRHDGQEVVWNHKEAAEEEEVKKAYTERIFKVYGNCGMCKTRIESAVGELDGIFFAFWNDETEMLHVRFDADLTSQEAIEEHVADVGHDTENFKADDTVYENLHGCCKYDRGH